MVITYNNLKQILKLHVSIRKVTWYSLLGTGNYPTILQWTEMFVTNNSFCHDSLQEKSPSYYVTENMVCAGDGDFTERDTCQVCILQIFVSIETACTFRIPKQNWKDSGKCLLFKIQLFVVNFLYQAKMITKALLSLINIKVDVFQSFYVFHVLCFQGDSGGPMTVQNAEGLFEIVGLTSWGYRYAV